MQRLHEDDLVGHVLTKEDWEVLSIPAIAEEEAVFNLGRGRIRRRVAGELLHPEREPREILDRLRINLGSMNFSAQYQQRPVPPGGAVIRREWLRWHEDEDPDAFDLKVASWDTASTLGEASDWSVGTVWGLRGEDVYLLDVARGKWEVPDLRRRIEGLSAEHEVDATLIEETDIGRALVQEMRRHGALSPPPILTRPRFDKQARMLAQSPRFEAGGVLLPREAPWLGTYLAELLAFPNGTHDDQVDSTSQALKWLSKKIAARRPEQRPPGRPEPKRPRGRIHIGSR